MKVRKQVRSTVRYVEISRVPTFVTLDGQKQESDDSRKRTEPGGAAEEARKPGGAEEEARKPGGAEEEVQEPAGMEEVGGRLTGEPLQSARAVQGHEGPREP